MSKAQKQIKNREDHKLDNNFRRIADMDNHKTYAVQQDGKPLLMGMQQTGKFWKTLYGIYEEN